MTPERWRQVKAILSGAMDRPESERAEYLNVACGADAELRRDVDSLLPGALRENEVDPHADDELARELIATAAFAAFSEASRQSSTLIDDLQQVLGSEYRLVKELGGGGMSRVFLGVEVALDDRPVVVKVLNPEQAEGASAERFAREVRFAARLQQANIVPVLRVGKVRDLAFYIMPYHGKTLRDSIASGALSTTEAIDHLKNVAKALACAHSEGVVHRDIKPENILLSGGTAVVADFGIAKTISSIREAPMPNGAARSGFTTAIGQAVGTPAYMAPEQAAADRVIGPPADIYALGIVAYELLAGAHPFGHKHGAKAYMAAQVLETPAPLSAHRSDVSPALIGLVMRCLEKKPESRPQNGSELLAALNAIEASTLGEALTDNAFQSMASIAVLPFDSLSGEAANDALPDGIANELHNALMRMHGLRVVRGTSALAFEGKSTDPRSIARDLGVESVVQGTIMRAGSRVGIGVQLNGADGRHIWGAQYLREEADIFAVQEELAHAIATALDEKRVRERRSARAIAPASRVRHRTVSSDAFQLYLTGRSLLEQRSDGMQRGLECLEKATQLAPEFSEAHAAISMAYTLFGIYNIQRPTKAFPKARAEAELALEIDADDVLAIVMRAHTALWHEWDFQAAEARARRALELAPSFYLAHECLGYVLAAQGRFDESIDAMEKGRSLDPISENATHDLAWALLLAGRWNQAIRELEPALAKYPQMSELRRVYGFCLFYAGRVQEAFAQFKRVLELKVGDRWGSLNLVQALAALGEVDEAQRRVAELEARAVTEPIPSNGIAIMHHWLGNDEAALTWLEKSVEARDYWLVMAPFDPSLIRLRDNPRFRQLIRRVHTVTPTS